jgi:hypothetical protein
MLKVVKIFLPLFHGCNILSHSHTLDHMAHLSLVKKLSHLQEEQRHSQEFLEAGNLKLLRGSLTEFVGPRSTGKTSLAFMLLSALTQKGEICAVVDLNNSFNPRAAVNCGIELENILWVRCNGNIEHAFRAADNLIQAKNFGLILIDLNDHNERDLGHIPSSYWYRFRTRIKGSQTVFIITANRALMGAASNQSFHLEAGKTAWSGANRFKLIDHLQIALNTQKPSFVKPESLKIAARY